MQCRPFPGRSLRGRAHTGLTSLQPAPGGFLSSKCSYIASLDARIRRENPRETKDEIARGDDGDAAESTGGKRLNVRREIPQIVIGKPRLEPGGVDNKLRSWAKFVFAQEPIHRANAVLESDWTADHDCDNVLILRECVSHNILHLSFSSAASSRLRSFRQKIPLSVLRNSAPS